MCFFSLFNYLYLKNYAKTEIRSLIKLSIRTKIQDRGNDKMTCRAYVCIYWVGLTTKDHHAGLSACGGACFN